MAKGTLSDLEYFNQQMAEHKAKMEAERAAFLAEHSKPMTAEEVGALRLALRDAIMGVPLFGADSVVSRARALADVGAVAGVWTDRRDAAARLLGL